MNDSTSREGQQAIVIGGTGALGAAIVERLAMEGADVAFTYHSSSKKAEALAERVKAATGRHVSAAQADCADAKAIAAFTGTTVERAGRLDTLVYAAGPSFELQFTGQVSPEEFGRVVDADIKGCFHAVHAALPHLRASQGSIVAVTTAGVARNMPRDTLSIAPKAAVTMLIRQVALEEGRAGVRANCVAPGFMDGGLGAQMLDEVGADVASQIIKGVPLRRLGRPEEIADAVDYLTSPRASFVTGCTLFVTGGLEL